MPSPLNQSLLHESGWKHVTGEALYVDDWPAPSGMLVAQIVSSTCAHGHIIKLDVSAARQVPGVVAVLTAQDIPGENDVGPVVHDEELLASKTVHFYGQAVALVVGETLEACRAGAKQVQVEYAPLHPSLSLDEALEHGSFLTSPHIIERGNVETGLKNAAIRFQGEVRTGAQDHFYLETQVTLAIPQEGPALRLLSSTQHPSEVQATVAKVLGWTRHQVVVEVPRLGGGFGGKETQAAPFAALAALAAQHLGRPVKVWLNRDQDMLWTGKRHPFFTRFDVGFDDDGTISALDAQLFADGGFSSDLSSAILDRALFHVDNAYFLPHVRLTGRVAKTNLPSNTAFRGFGGPQGMAVIEEIINRFCERTGLDALEVRRKNFYRESPRHVTPYGQEVPDNRLFRIVDQLLEQAEWAPRQHEMRAFNAAHRQAKRALALTPVKFGISFTTSFLNQAGALVLVYADGSVQLNHGGIEMGQGLHTKMQAICAHELGVRLDQIRVMTTATDKVPNTSATAASAGADLNGQAVKQACETLRSRLVPVAGPLLGLEGVPAEDLHFEGGEISCRLAPQKRVTFQQVVSAAYLAQVPLFATGYYRTPGIAYDRSRGQGTPFHYFAYGAAATEVELSGLTGEHRVRRVDIVHDVGTSLVPTVDRGQIEGGFVQGLGWLTCEEVLFDARGQVRTHGPDTYKIPALGNAPLDFRVTCLANAAQANVIHGSKAVGEPPLMLALSVVAALRQAVAAFGPPGREVDLKLPATPEALLWAVEKQRAS